MGFHLRFAGNVFVSSAAAIYIVNLLLLSGLAVVLLFDLLIVGSRFLMVLLLSDVLFFVLFGLELSKQCVSPFRLHAFSIFDVALHVSVV